LNQCFGSGLDPNSVGSGSGSRKSNKEDDEKS
jgi:hypothetical protein